MVQTIESAIADGMMTLILQVSCYQDYGQNDGHPNQTVCSLCGLLSALGGFESGFSMLAVMGHTFSMKPQAPTPDIQRDLKELHVARQALIKDRTRALNRQKTLTLPTLKRQAKARITQ